MANTVPKNPWILRNGSVNANSENIITEIDEDNFQGIKLILIVFNKSEKKRRVKEYNITKISNNDIRYNCFGIIGDSIDFEVFLDIVLNKLQLKIKNNSLFDLDVELQMTLLGRI